MNEIKKLLGLVKAASDKVRDQLSTIEDDIEAAYIEQGKLLNGPLSKVDYIAVIRLDVQRRAGPYKENLALSLAENNSTLDYASMDFVHSRTYTEYLTAGSRAPHPMSEAAYYYYFEDVIVAGIERALAEKVWPTDTVPMAKRGALIKAVDKRINGLMVERDSMVKNLLECGVTQ